MLVSQRVGHYCSSHLLYTTAPGVAAFARVNMIETINSPGNTDPSRQAGRTKLVQGNWESTGLVGLGR